MQVALTGDVKPSRAALEHHTAELETELLHMHSQCGQLKVRLAVHTLITAKPYVQVSLINVQIPT